MKTVKGDLIKLAKEGKFDIIAHGCNCFNTMGAGIALQIARNFPSAMLIDKNTLSSDINKLGGFTKTYTMVSNGSKKLDIFNLYTQYQPGKNLDLEALTLCFRKLDSLYTNKTIGIPFIGCGIAGGNWNFIKKIIETEVQNNNIIVVDYEQ